MDIASYGSQSKRAKIAIHRFGKCKKGFGGSTSGQGVPAQNILK